MEMPFGGQMLRKDKVRMMLFQVCLSLETNISHKHALEFQFAEGTAQASSVQYKYVHGKS